MAKNYLSATVHCYLNGREDYKKFRHIKNTSAALERMDKFARTFPGADYINYYWEDPPQNFAFRRYVTPKTRSL